MFGTLARTLAQCPFSTYRLSPVAHQPHTVDSGNISTKYRLKLFTPHVDETAKLRRSLDTRWHSLIVSAVIVAVPTYRFGAIMPSLLRLAKSRSVFPSLTTMTTISRMSPITNRLSMHSPSFLDIGVSDDAPNWHPQISPESAAHWVYAKSIQTSQQDDREYRLIRLENGLQAMLIQDAKADKAAASLDVAVGHLHDPVSNSGSTPKCDCIANSLRIQPDMPGLAHFCEHLLFMVFTSSNWNDRQHSLTANYREPSNFQRRTSTLRFITFQKVSNAFDDCTVSFQE